MKDLRYETHEGLPVEESAIVDKGLGEFNEQAAPLHEVQGLSCFVRDPSGRVVGGAVGRWWGALCELRQLWVEAGLRGHGVGARLLQEFERLAIQKGCQSLYLETLSFQAPLFYEKLGYRTAFVLSGYPHGISKRYMVKAVGSAEAAPHLTRTSGIGETVVVIRPAVPTDMPGIWDVRYAVTENTLSPGRISDEDLGRSIEEGGRGWVAVQEGRIVGFAIGLLDGNVWALFVRPESEGRGIGSALHDEMLAWFSRQRVDRLWLSTGAHTRARAFYEARGWQYAGPNGPDEVRLERPSAA